MRQLLNIRSNPNRVYTDPKRGNSRFRVSYRLQGGNFKDGTVLSSVSSGVTNDWNYRDYTTDPVTNLTAYTGFSVTENDIPLLITSLNLEIDADWSIIDSEVVADSITSAPVLLTIAFDDLNSDSQTIDVLLYVDNNITVPEITVFRLPDEEVAGPVTGSAARAVWDAMETFAAAANANTTLARALFTVEDDVTPTYTRNPDCWLASIQEKLTSESPWNSRGGKLRSGTLVADDIAIFAAHFPVLVGDTVRFVNAANEVFDYTVESTMRINYDLYTLQSETTSTVTSLPSDVLVVRFTEIVDASIYRSRFLPQPCDSYFPTAENFQPIVKQTSTGIWSYSASSPSLPVIVTRQNNTVNSAISTVAGEFAPATGIAKFSGNWIYPTRGDPDLSRLEATWVGGDSGSICWLLLGDDLIAHQLAFQADGGGFALSTLTPKIEEAITALGSAASLNYVDLSVYNEYPYDRPVFADPENIIT